MTTSTKRRRYTSHSKAIRTSAQRRAATKHHNRKLALALTSNGAGVGERKARMERARTTVARKQGRRKPKSYGILAGVTHDITRWWQGTTGRRRK